MGYLTKYGSMWGDIPKTNGQVFWVAAAASYVVDGITYTASDSEDGLSPARAKLTLAGAVTAATANVNDVIVLLHGAHSWAASVALSKAGLTITGLPGGKGHPGYKRTSVTVSVDDEIINVTAADIEIAHIQFIPVTTKAAIDYTAAADRLYVHDCSFDMYTAVVNTGTKGIASTSAIINADRLCVENCYFESDGAQGPAIDVGDGNKYLIRDNLFVSSAGAWAKACEASGVTNQTGMWIGNRFMPHAGATMTDGVTGSDMTSASSVHFYGNFFGHDVTVPIDDFGAGDANIAENYLASDGASSGGALIIVIT